jgi:hypothetical protein
MTVLTRKERPLRSPSSLLSQPARPARRQRFAEAPDRGDLDPRHLEACGSRRDHDHEEAPDAGEAAAAEGFPGDQEFTHGRSQS